MSSADATLSVWSAAATVSAAPDCTASTACADVDDIDAPGDEPLLALARQELLSWHHRVFALAVGAHWPLGGSRMTKSVRAMVDDGLVAGTQGSHARFLFGQLQAQARGARVDALLPSAPGAPDRDTAKEFTSWGIAPRTAESASIALADAMARGAASAALLRRTLATAAAAGSGSAGALRLVLHRSGELIDVPAAFGGGAGGFNDDAGGSPARVPPGSAALLVFEPSADDAAQWLAPVRAAATLPSRGGVPYGRQRLPLYTSATLGDGKAALAAAGIVTGPFTAVLELNGAHLNKLCALAERSQRKAPNLLCALFCVVARYETFSGNTGGIQGALPHHVFDVLEETLGIEGECFASPLNAHFPAYCSAFPDTDAYFGSRGSFFDWSPRRGAFQANPPFVNATMLAMALRIEELLDTAAAAHEPLLFFVVVPSWADARFHRVLVGSRFRRAEAQLAAKEHDYIDGLQWRMPRASPRWSSNVDSTWVLLCTDEAARALPPGATELVAAAFAARVGEGPSARVFKHDVGR